MSSDRSKSFATDPAAVRPVSRRTDAAEIDAARAAADVLHGRSVSMRQRHDGSLAEGAIHRQESGGAGKSDEDKKLEALKKAGEALLEIEAGKTLRKKVLDDPLVKGAIDAATSPAGIAAGVVAGGGVVAGLAAAGKELPIQPPEIPLDKITPGLSGKVTLTGPLNAPTFVGLAITYKERGPKDRRPKQTETEKLRAENARRAAELASFRAGLRFAPGSKETEEQRHLDEAINWVVSKPTRDLGIPGLSGTPGVVLPLVPDDARKRRDEPVQRAPASASAPPVHEAAVDGAVSGPGRPLDSNVRVAMESRFGHDFSSVRIHDDARSAAAAASIDAAAFTLGSDIVFGAGRFGTATPDGIHLLAHELAHVVQQTNAETHAVHRQPAAAPAVARPAISVDQGVYEQNVRRSLNALTSRLVQSTTLARAVLPILRAMAATPVWRDLAGGELGGGTFPYSVPGTANRVLNLRLVLDDMIDPPEAGQFSSRGGDGTITVRVRRVTGQDQLSEVLYHESLHMMTWIMGTHGGAAAVAGSERSAARALDMSRFATQIAGIRRTLDQLAQSVNARRSNGGAGPRITSSDLDRMSSWLMEEIQVRAETEVFRQAQQVDANRGRGPAVYIGTSAYGSIDRRMVDSYVFDFSRVFAPADRNGLTAPDQSILRVLMEQLEGFFQLHVRRRFSLTAYTTQVPRAEPEFRQRPLTPPTFVPRILDSVKGEPF